MTDVIVIPGHDNLARGRVKNIDVSVSGGAVSVAQAPTIDASGAITPLSTSVAANSLVLKASPGNFYGANCATIGISGYLMLFDAIAKPPDGTVTPKKVWVVGAGQAIEAGYNVALRMSVGVTLAFSTTGPFTLTGATAFISGEAL